MFVKVFGNNYHYDYEKEGIYEAVEEYPNKDVISLVFYDIETVFEWLFFGNKVAVIELLPDSIVEEDKKFNRFKTNIFEIVKILPLSDIETWKYLVEHGADIFRKNSEALKWAAMNGHLEIVKYLVEKGVDINLENGAAIRFAAAQGHLEIVTYLIENGANILVKKNFAFRWAAMNGHLEVVQYLIEKKCVDIEAIQWAKNNGHPDVVKYIRSTF